jgi:hypothetical protein
VKRDDQGQAATWTPAQIDLGRDALVVRRVDGQATLFAGVVSETHVSRHGRAIGDRQDSLGGPGIAVAVDDESGERLAHERRIEEHRHPLSQRSHPDVPRNVARAIVGTHSQISETLGNGVARMISDEQ